MRMIFFRVCQCWFAVCVCEGLGWVYVCAGWCRLKGFLQDVLMARWQAPNFFWVGVQKLDKIDEKRGASNCPIYLVDTDR